MNSISSSTCSFRFREASPRRKVMDSMHTLFMAITGGLNWFDAYAPLRKVSLMALWLMLLGFRGGEDMQRLAKVRGVSKPSNQDVFLRRSGKFVLLGSLHQEH